MTTKEDMIDTIKVVMNYLYKDVGDTWYGDLLSDVLEELNNGDAVEVVRCKDCKWQITAYCPMPSWERKDNHYCYKGEREEDVSN